MLDSTYMFIQCVFHGVLEPNFVYMDFVRESVDSPDGDDDKIYLFFSETAMEYDFYSKLIVSRVARVCKVFVIQFFFFFFTSHFIKYRTQNNSESLQSIQRIIFGIHTWDIL